ncbi:MAG: (2Fe-2S) ferredoxin domain-containing protein [Lachnospiraceae bacterium]
MKIQICVGSSCHLRGSEEVIQTFRKLCKTHQVNAVVELCGSFCMGTCSKGVSVRVDGQDIFHVKPEDAEDFFTEEILRRLA